MQLERATARGRAARLDRAACAPLLRHRDGAPGWDHARRPGLRLRPRRRGVRWDKYFWCSRRSRLRRAAVALRRPRQTGRPRAPWAYAWRAAIRRPPTRRLGAPHPRPRQPQAGRREEPAGKTDYGTCSWAPATTCCAPSNRRPSPLPDSGVVRSRHAHPMRLLFVADPLEQFNIKKDSTFCDDARGRRAAATRSRLRAAPPGGGSAAAASARRCARWR